MSHEVHCINCTATKRKVVTIWNPVQVLALHPSFSVEEDNSHLASSLVRLVDKGEETQRELHMKMRHEN